MKRYSIIATALVLLICASVYAAEVNSIAATKIRAEADNVIVPIELKNVIAMSALDLPLKFSEGVTLVDVTFEGTRSEDFDFKWANIDNDNNTVVIGLIPMVYGEKPDLAPGEGVVANLVFSIDDPTVETIEVTPTSMENPHHSLMLVYNDDSNGKAEVKQLVPEFSGVSVALSEVVTTDRDMLPITFDLKQNAPNPFNPTTRIDYDLPSPAHVKLNIFNVLGQHVNTLVDGFQEAGSMSVIWDGRDNYGGNVASGIYFYRIEAGKYVATKKMMMLK